jgi:hypothetical protein
MYQKDTPVGLEEPDYHIEEKAARIKPSGWYFGAEDFNPIIPRK